MKKLIVDLANYAYPIYLGHQLDLATLFHQHHDGQQVMIVTNDTVAPLYLARIQAALGSCNVATCILPDGEKYKTLDSYQLIMGQLLTHRFARDCVIIGLGGGVIGDMAGFAAATYQRGVRFIQIPTTLLAQVDSSVGGKTGVNHTLGKNMIGAFKQPICVLADIAMLESLPQREFAAGLAEVIKYALIVDYDFFVWLEAHMPRIKQHEPELLLEMIYRSCHHKAGIVAEDEFETGRRALLNLGHTFGHAIETLTHYEQYLHGEAVAIGMLMAAELSQLMGLLANHDVVRIRDLLIQAGLPVRAQRIDPDDMLEVMGRDKKVLQQQLRLILLKQIGEAYIDAQVDRNLLKQIVDIYGE